MIHRPRTPERARRMGESQTLELRNPESNRAHFYFHTPDRSPTQTTTNSPGYTHTIRNCNPGSRPPSQGNRGDYQITSGIAGCPNPVSTRALAKDEPVHRGSGSTIQARTPTTTIGTYKTDNNQVIAIPRDSSTTDLFDPNHRSPNPTTQQQLRLQRSHPSAHPASDLHPFYRVPTLRLLITFTPRNLQRRRQHTTFPK